MLYQYNLGVEVPYNIFPAVLSPVHLVCRRLMTTLWDCGSCRLHCQTTDGILFVVPYSFSISRSGGFLKDLMVKTSKNPE